MLSITARLMSMLKKKKTVFQCSFYGSHGLPSFLCSSVLPSAYSKAQELIILSHKSDTNFHVSESQ